MRGERSSYPKRDIRREQSSYGSSAVKTYKMSPEELEDFRAKNAYVAPMNSNGKQEKLGMDIRNKPKVVAVTEKKESDSVGHTVKKGPDKEFVLSRIAGGKSIASVERELGMKVNELHYWIRKWDWVGITPGKAKAILSGEPIEEVIKLEEVKPVAPDSGIVAPQNVLDEFKERIAVLVNERNIAVKEVSTLAEELACAKQAIRELEEERQLLLTTIEGAVTRGVDNGHDPDLVNHPSHYTAGGIEVIDFIVAKLTGEEFSGFCKGNVLKYVSRANHKNGLEDLRKAKWYVDRLIEEVNITEA